MDTNVVEKTSVSTPADSRRDPRDPGQIVDGLAIPRRYWAVLSIWLAIAMAVLDASIANIALPTIAHDVGASAASSIWVISAYQIAIVMALLPFAALGEILTYRQIYMAGLALFALASVGCALSQTLVELALARFVQGLGAAGVMAVNGALVRFTYPKAKFGRGVGYNALVVGLSSAVGPSFASSVLALASWPWLFAVTVPLASLSLVIGYQALPESEPSGRRFDGLSAGLSAVAFGAFFVTGSELGHGVYRARSLAEAGLTLVSAVALVKRSRKQSRPILPLDLLRIPILRLSYAASICAFGAQMIILIALPFYLQGMRLDTLAIGLLITPFPLGIAIAAPLAGRLVERFSAGLLGGAGLIILAIAFAALTCVPGPPQLTIAPAMLIAGFGFGLFQTPNNRTMLGTGPAERSGAAAGLQAVARLVGQTLGAISVAFLFRIASPGSQWPIIVAAGISLLASLFSLKRLRA